MKMPEQRDFDRWAYLTDGLGAEKAERESWICMVLGLAGAVVAAAFVAYVLAQTSLPLGIRAIAGVAAFFVVLYLARRECMDRAATSAGEPEAKAPAARPAARPAAAPAPSPTPAPAPAADADVGRRPEALTAARAGGADDLKKIKGVGPKLEQLCNSLGFYHFDQIAGWSADEVAWVDANLEGFKGRVTRDDWVAQAKILAAGGETEFSRRQG